MSQTNKDKAFLIANQCQPCTEDFYNGILQGVKLTLDAEDDFWEKTFKGLQTEIKASMLILPPHDDYKKGWNDSLRKALRFIEMSHKKEGLFQL